MDFFEVDEMYDEYEVVMDEEFMNEKEFDSDDSKPWDWEDRLYEEWRDRQMMSEMEKE
jgi:hypothetical protein